MVYEVYYVPGLNEIVFSKEDLSRYEKSVSLNGVVSLEKEDIYIR